MKLEEIMSRTVVKLTPEDTAETAARLLERYHIGALPVCDSRDRICGILTDRDLVVRCMASGADPKTLPVSKLMTTGVVTAEREMDTAQASELMGRHQVRRLAVTEQGRLCGMVSLGDLARNSQGAQALESISQNVSAR